jgi:hypothetical protein
MNTQTKTAGATKMILMIADAGCLGPLRRELAALGASGYTVIGVAEGAGRTGLHTGDRVHPGGLVAVLVIEPEERARTLFDQLVKRRDASGDCVTRFFLLPVERQA